MLAGNVSAGLNNRPFSRRQMQSDGGGVENAGVQDEDLQVWLQAV